MPTDSRPTALLRVELHTRRLAAVDVEYLGLDFEVRLDHLWIHPQLLAITVSFVQLTFHSVLEIKHLAKHYTHTDHGIQRVRCNMLANYFNTNVITAHVIHHRFLTIHQLRVHLMRQRVNAHGADVLLNELVHFNGVFMRVKAAQEALVVVHAG